MKKANLHNHSIYSDGVDTPEEVVLLAAEVGVELLSLTDHNTFEGYPRFEKACEFYNINFIKGVEIDCMQPELGFTQELLAYFPDGGEECLEEVLRYKRRARLNRAVKAMNRAGEHFNVDVSLKEFEALAIAEKGTSSFLSNKLLYRYLKMKINHLPDYLIMQESDIWKGFWKKEGDDLKYTLYELIPLVKQAGGIPVLAHFGFHFKANPLIMREKEGEYLDHLRYMKSLGLWGIELHPYRYKPQRYEVNEILIEWAAKVGLKHTVGSDYHGGHLSSHKIFDWFQYEFDGFD